MMSPFVRASLAALTLSSAMVLAVPARAFDPAAVAIARRDLQSAVDRAELGGLLAARARFAALAAAEPQSARLQLWVATATWRALPLLMARDATKAGRLGDDALDRLEKLLAGDPGNAEALAMKGALQGLVLSLRPAEMMTLGPQSFANLARAAALSGADPRTHLLTGIGRLHEPEQYGGGPRAALAEFRRAQELFASEAVSDSTAPDWGRDDAFLWEGRARMQLGDFAAAREAFRRALEANADNQWVRSRLLPAAEDSLRRERKS